MSPQMIAKIVFLVLMSACALASVATGFIMKGKNNGNKDVMFARKVMKIRMILFVLMLVFLLICILI